MNHQKMVVSAKNMDTLAKVAGRIFEIVGIVLVVFAVLTAALGEKIFETASMSLDLDFVTLQLSEECQQVTEAFAPYVIIGLLEAVVVCGAVAIICKLLRRILEPMKEGRPFQSGASGDLRKIGWVVLTAGILRQTAGCVLNLLLIRLYPMDQIFASDAIAGITYNFTFDLNFVLISCGLFLLSYIFSYGQMLQQESDETL